MPRNRTVRLAVLGSSVQRTATSKYSSRTSSALRRRIAVGFLVALSFVLITLSFGDDGVSAPQSAGATVLRPFQIGAERIARPFRDAYGWFAALVDAKQEADRLRRDLAAARAETSRLRVAAADVEQLRAMTRYQAPPALEDFAKITAAVVAYPGPFARELTIEAGSADGVVENAPVIRPEGLVGRVTAVTRGQAKVTLLVDGSSSVGAMDARTRDRGIARGRPGSESLLLDFVPRDARIREGDTIVTAGAEQGSDLPSYYPRGIEIGRVSYASQSDTEHYKTVQVDPSVDFDAVESVIVLVRRTPRAQ